MECHSQALKRKIMQANTKISNSKISASPGPTPAALMLLKMYVVTKILPSFLSNLVVYEKLNVTFVGFYRQTLNIQTIQQITNLWGKLLHKHLFTHMHKHCTSFLPLYWKSRERERGWRSMLHLWQMTRGFHHPNKHLLIQLHSQSLRMNRPGPFHSLALINTLQQPGSWQALRTFHRGHQWCILGNVCLAGTVRDTCGHCNASTLTDILTNVLLLILNHAADTQRPQYVLRCRFESGFSFICAQMSKSILWESV